MESIPQIEGENNTNTNVNSTPENNNHNEITKPKRNIRPTKRSLGLNFDENINIATYMTDIISNQVLPDPVTYKQAINSLNSKNWIDAMQTEINMLKQRNTWTIVDIPKNRYIIGTKFVYKTKLKANGAIDKYKARLVVQGFSQRPGEDYLINDTFAPVARLSTVRLILSYSATMNWEIHQIDIKSAYLYGELNNNEEIYIKPPPGDLVKVKENQCLLLKKALYGLKQAGRRWYQTLRKILNTLDFNQSQYDNATFYKNNNKHGSTDFIIFVHVDDMTLCAQSIDNIRNFKKSLSKLLEFTDSGEINSLLGIEIKRDRTNKAIYLRQKHYIESILKRYKFDNIPNKKIPVKVGEKFESTTTEEILDSHPYMNMIGAIRYIADCTRPDISFTASLLARYLTKPNQKHYDAVKYVYGYLNYTRHKWLKLGANNSTIKLEAYCYKLRHICRTPILFST